MFIKIQIAQVSWGYPGDKALSYMTFVVISLSIEAWLFQKYIYTLVFRIVNNWSSELFL